MPKKALFSIVLIFLLFLVTGGGIALLSHYSIWPFKKITLVLHAGLEKTGTSSLQRFFCTNSVSLEKEGILYPNVPDIKITARNVSQILQVYKRDPFYFYKIYFQALRKNCHTVILSSEIMTTNPEELYEILKKHPMFNVKIILYVRELYGFSWSYYQQDVKNARQPPDPDHSKNIPPLNLDFWLRSSFKDRLILINFDVHKKDLLLSFFKRLNLPVSKINIKGLEQVNRSLSESEHNILNAFVSLRPDFYRRKISDRFIEKNPTADNFRYYDPKWAQKIYHHNMAALIKANSLLPKNEKLPTAPFNPPKYTTTWNKKNILPEDVKTVLEVLGVEHTFRESSFKKLCPKGFDMYKYLALNPDVMVAEVDPYQHYVQHGQQEKRPWELKNN